ncbi:MAG: HD domain-containing protein [Pyrinomonadaceae bacterium]
MPERNYRDAVHNIIRIDTSTPDGALAARLIDTPEFQRLRRIRQLGLAFFAYQSAEHSRFTHSLGAFHIATRLLDRLGSKYQIEENDRIAVRIAALLHDVGHGPFSHVMESILAFHHEEYTIGAVLDSKTAIGQVLGDFSPEIADSIAAIIRGNFRQKSLGQLISSQLDADRMDYLLRDSMMTGVKYGIYDLEWIIRSLEIDQSEDRLYVSSRGLYAVEDYLQARYYMFRQVYFHRTLRAAECVLRSLMRRAIELSAAGEPIFRAANTAFDAILTGRALSVKEHFSLDDNDVLFHIKQWRNNQDPILADLSSRFLDRRLFKILDLDMPEDRRSEFIQNACNAVIKKGFDADYYFIEDTAGDEPYFFYSGSGAAPKDLIFVETGFSSPSLKEISEISPAVRGLQRGCRIHRVCFPEEARNEILSYYRN